MLVADRGMIYSSFGWAGSTQDIQPRGYIYICYRILKNTVRTEKMTLAHFSLFRRVTHGHRCEVRPVAAQELRTDKDNKGSGKIGLDPDVAFTSC